MYGEREVLRDFFDIYVSLSLSLSLSTLEEFVETKALKRVRKTGATNQKQVGWIGWKKLEWLLMSFVCLLSLWSSTTEDRRCVCLCGLFCVCTCWGFFGSSTIFLLSWHEYISDELRSHFHFSWSQLVKYITLE